MAEIYFPQLNSGTLAQYPLNKTTIGRTIKNVLADGRLILLPDPAARRVRWSLKYTNISADEVQMLQGVFRLCNGPLKAFTFLDPAANLLSWSTDLRNPIWLQDNQIQIDAGFADPLGGGNGFRLTNTGQTETALSQMIPAPTYFVYSLSVYLRSSTAATVDLQVKGQSTQTRNVSCDSRWTRFDLTSQLQEQSYQVSAGVVLAPGQTIEIYGPQLEAQRATSGYRPTAAKAGIHQSSHFAMNELVVTAEAPGKYSVGIVIESVS